MCENNGESLTIIVVDDCEDIRLMLRFALEKRGYQVLEAENGRVGVELAIRNPPALILMDLNMPVLDGFAAMRLLRQHKSTCDTPIIAVSANIPGNYRTDNSALGFTEYITKPVNFNHLDRVVSNLLAA